MSCLFCKIVNGEIPSTKVYEDEHVLAFEDIAPDAPVHTLVIPKQHVTSLMDLNDPALMQHLIKACQQVAKDKGVDDGFRLVTNIGEDGGQSVFHLHFHLIGGRPLSWPPG